MKPKNWIFGILFAALCAVSAFGQGNFNVNITGYTATSDVCQQATVPKFNIPLSQTSSTTAVLVPAIGTQTTSVCSAKFSLSGTTPTVNFGTSLGTLPTPVNTTFTTATTGGHAAAGATVYYRITGTNNSAAGSGLASAETSIKVGTGTSTNEPTVQAVGFNGATGCNVYRSYVSGLEVFIATGTLANGVCTYADSATTTVSPFAISAISESGTLVTVTVASSTWMPGEPVTVLGTGISGYNGTWTIVTGGTTSFTYNAIATGLSSGSTGTAAQPIPTANTSGGVSACVATSGVFTPTAGSVVGIGDGGGNVQFNSNPGGTICAVTGATSSMLGFMSYVHK